MEDYVTYEQSVKLKELGFDWECYHYYNDDKKLWSYTSIGYGDDCRDWNDKDYAVIGNAVCSAPTLAQAQKWLYNRFSLWIEITYEVERESFEYNIFNKSDNTKKSFFNPWVKIIYDTPTKALSAGIDKALEIIKTI